MIKAKVAKHRNGPIGEVPLQFREAEHALLRGRAARRRGGLLIGQR